MRIKQIILNIVAYFGCIFIGFMLMVCSVFKRDKNTEDYIDEDW